MLHYLKSIRNFEKSKRYLSDTYMNSNLIDKILNEISLDSRIPDGTFRIEEDSHMEVLREYFTSKGIDESLVIEYSNRVLEGKYPERQAYNAKGILVTFPTPEYKADAIKRGTHFEEDPTKQAQNIFQTSTPAAAPKQPTKPAAGGDTKTSLPMSQTSTQPEPTANPSPAAPTATPQPTLTVPPPAFTPTDTLAPTITLTPTQTFSNAVSLTVNRSDGAG